MHLPRTHLHTGRTYTHTHIYLLLDMSQLWPLRTRFAVWGITPSVRGGFPTPRFYSISLLSGTRRHSTFTLHISCLGPAIDHFSKELWILLLENRIKNGTWVLGGLFATAMSFLVGPLAARVRTWMSVCPPCTRTDLSLFLYVAVSICPTLRCSY